jgi:hypothetical protein
MFFSLDNLIGSNKTVKANNSLSLFDPVFLGVIKQHFAFIYPTKASLCRDTLTVSSFCLLPVLMDQSISLLFWRIGKL